MHTAKTRSKPNRRNQTTMTADEKIKAAEAKAAEAIKKAEEAKAAEAEALKKAAEAQKAKEKADKDILNLKDLNDEAEKRADAAQLEESKTAKAAKKQKKVTKILSLALISLVILVGIVGYFGYKTIKDQANAKIHSRTEEVKRAKTEAEDKVKKAEEDAETAKAAALAEAEKPKAEAEAEALRIKAIAEAEAIRIKAAAEAEKANALAEIERAKAKAIAENSKKATPEEVEVQSQDQDGPREKVQELNNYRRQNGGSVVRFIGKPVKKGGRTFLPLFKDPNNKGALTEPIDKDLATIQENMSFIGCKPPVGGKLAVFDVVRDSRTEKLYNILALEIQNQLP